MLCHQPQGRLVVALTHNSIHLRRVLIVGRHPMVDQHLMAGQCHMLAALPMAGVLRIHRLMVQDPAAGIAAPGAAATGVATGLVATEVRMEITAHSEICLAAIEARMEIAVLSATCLVVAVMASGACILMNG